MTKNKKLVYVGFSFNHMGQHAGYDLIKKHVNYDIFIDCQKSFNWKDKFYHKKGVLKSLYFKIIGSRLWWIELYCIWLAITRKNLVFHFIYPENVYKYLGYFKGQTVQIICTYHQPKIFMDKWPKLQKGLKKVDKIIVLSKEEVPGFEMLSGRNNVHFIPHGVDIQYFKPSEIAVKTNSILMVGNWLRDFEFANTVFEELLQRQDDLKIFVVASPRNLENFSSHTNLHLMSNISDDELLHLYQQSKVLFLPLNSFVANNALLEGAACGCNIIIATNNPTSNYFGRDLIKVYPKNVEILVNKISEQLMTPKNAAESLRTKVENAYSWEKIGDETESLLRF